MAELEIRNATGQVVGKHTLGDKLASAKVNANAIHRTVVAEEANARQGTQSAKTRSEVRGGGRKPYRQKKTGNARQGSTRAPHYAHGGMALAVKPRDYDKKVNKRERRTAILSALASKIESGSLILAESLNFAEPKTKQAVELLKALGVDQVARVLVVLEEYHEPTIRSFRNLPNVTVRTAPAREGKSQAFGTRDVVVAHKVIASAEALRRCEEVWK